MPKTRKRRQKKKSFKEIDRNEFKKIVWEQGFSFEHDVFKLLQDSGWFLMPNRFFQESPAEKIREYDLLAYKTFPFSLKGKVVNLYIVLIIECKYNPHKVVFYTRPLSEHYPLKLHLGSKLLEVFPEEKSVQLTFRRIKKYRKFFYLDQQIFGYQSFLHNEEAIDKKERTIKPDKKLYKVEPNFTNRIVFKSINSVTAATRFERIINKDEWETSDRLCLFFPIAVFSGNLHRAYISDRRKIINKASIFKYKAGERSIKKRIIPDEYCIHIIDQSEIKKSIKIFDEMYTYFKKEISQKIKTLVKNKENSKKLTKI